jgi:hypothetical protein
MSEFLLHATDVTAMQHRRVASVRAGWGCGIGLVTDGVDVSCKVAPEMRNTGFLCLVVCGPADVSRDEGNTVRRRASLMACEFAAVEPVLPHRLEDRT